ncbi:MAG: UDP-N-acetylmuramate dehydrogenase [Allomuricauda sp.]|nr:MAG: UDP-N-acetylmuramate dehydrogenase [Allomuricauda sp.]
MNILENISLKDYNTFGIDTKAQSFVEITSLLQLQKALELTAYPAYFILGGGSNLLLTKNIDALVLYIALKGISIVEENDNEVVIKAMAGENWHELVLWTLENGYGGLENLSLIPGNVGTAPIQNIGAYGVELKDLFVSCEAMHLNSRELVEFEHGDCEFGYRDSVFKNAKKGQYVITSVKLRLTKKDHTLNTAYGAIEQELQRQEIIYPTIRDISNAVISIRQEKLPDPKKIGNSGSFFKNPVIGQKAFEKLQKKFPDIPHYRIDTDYVKVPAGWLIEQCGFKGKRVGDAAVHEKQALVLVNHGAATGAEILELAQDIQKVVKKNFKIELTPEVNIIK